MEWKGHMSLAVRRGVDEMKIHYIYTCIKLIIKNVNETISQQSIQ